MPDEAHTTGRPQNSAAMCPRALTQGSLESVGDGNISAGPRSSVVQA